MSLLSLPDDFSLLKNTFIQCYNLTDLNILFESVCQTRLIYLNKSTLETKSICTAKVYRVQYPEYNILWEHSH